ncbi:MAG: hypothetical protein EOO52_03825 [Gammaproteobacteria bacterium]|nr:MAG: hypothetical protein EOO52_03825 [Gammaproteobacteria bacterium]
MFSKILASIKSNKFLFLIAVILTVIIGYAIMIMFGILFTALIAVFFVSIYKAISKNNYKLALKITAGVVIVGGSLLFLLLLNHEWPSN